MKKNFWIPAWSLAAALFMAACLAHAEDPHSFSIVLMPDTQNYSEKYPETYLAQAQWIRDHAEAENIKFVIHVGDIVQNEHEENEWQLADAAHKLIDGHVPYSVVPGNHDLRKEEKKVTRDTPFFDKYFPPERFQGQPWYGGHFGANNACNYCTFEAAGMKFLVLSLSFAPDSAMLSWAGEVIQAHPEHRVIIATHYHMRPDGRATDEKPYGLDGYVGERLWENFIRKQPTVFMVVSGHVLGTHHQTATNDAGNPVHEILCDYQGEENGGNGWMQIMRFVPADSTIRVEAFSPTLNQIRTELPDTYTLEYAMTEELAEAAAH
ncbi:MAG TPA: metallophosphoesterase [Candidatus Hydrogenedentes bacterium]|nr:metallophosphoesterase [Candidatus Hydrogenedentota bacterium]HPJ99796.1 metallophosphoesterase [Candidatus Hydrogenedentota bacterium]